MIHEVPPNVRNITLDRLEANTEYELMVAAIYKNTVVGSGSNGGNVNGVAVGHAAAHTTYATGDGDEGRGGGGGLGIGGVGGNGSPYNPVQSTQSSSSSHALATPNASQSIRFISPDNGEL